MTPAQRLGDGPIDPALHASMNKIGRVMGNVFKNLGHGQWGFCLMVFPFTNFDGRCNYISNAKREDVLILLKEQVRRFEGAPDVEGHA
jgi:hypothetical protein